MKQNLEKMYKGNLKGVLQSASKFVSSWVTMQLIVITSVSAYLVKLGVTSVHTGRDKGRQIYDPNFPRLANSNAHSTRNMHSSN